MKHCVACGWVFLFTANMTLEVSQAVFLFEVSSAALQGLLRLCRVLPWLEHEMIHRAQGRKRMRFLTKAAMQQSACTRLLKCPPGLQRATVPEGQQGAGSCQRLLPSGLQGDSRALGVLGSSHALEAQLSMPPRVSSLGAAVGSVVVGGRMGGVSGTLSGLGLVLPAGSQPCQLPAHPVT